jgi:hypothetical protein
MHDGVMAHFSRGVRDVLDNTYHDRWIDRCRPRAWALRTPGFNPLNSYLWGLQEDLIYAPPVHNEKAIHHRIVDACQTILKLPLHL